MKNLHVISYLFTAILCLSSVAYAQAVPVSSYIEKALISSNDLKAVELDIQSLKMEIKARDLDLSPTLDLEVIRFWDERPSTSSNPSRIGNNATVSLNQPLATGTKLSMLSGADQYKYRTATQTDNVFNWQLGLTQSLWQDSFGRQTAFRRERDKHELRSRLLTLMLERQQYIINYEQIYWDLAYAQAELSIRQDNLERSKKILVWIQDRFNRLAAQKTDLLQGQTLVATRELQLQLAQDKLKTLKVRLKGQLPVDKDFSPLLDDLMNERNTSELIATVDFAPEVPTLIETLQAQAQAYALESEFKLESDKLKPTLEVGYSYGQQGINNSFNRAQSDSFRSGREYHQVGVVFSIPLDFHLLSTSRQSAKLKADAQQIRAQQLTHQSTLNWDDLIRTIEEQKRRIATAQTLAQLNKEKSQEERLLYEKGKTTAFQAITFEQEAAESELLVLELMTQLRNTEAQVRLYIKKSVGK